MPTADLITADHRFTVPLDHDRPDGERIELYAREVRAPGGERRPWLLFLGGGPGNPAPRPVDGAGWLARATADHRVLLLDQRGTGRSTPVTRHGIARRDDPAAHLALFRADAIVRDAEAIRRDLIGDEPWTVLGQSFGGFCVFTYLSFAPEGLRRAFTTGGVPGVLTGADDAYRALYPVVAARNDAHYARYPEDVDRVRVLARHLRDHDVRLPSGRRLTVRALQSLGNLLGGSTGSAQLHHLLEQPFADGVPSDWFLLQAERELTASSAFPLYWALHEATYANGGGPTAWSATRVLAEHPRFDADAALESDEPVLFTGEMVYPWSFDDPMLRPFRDAAHALAERSDWPALYDIDRLRANDVPIAAAVYEEDMYVSRDLSLSTAELTRGMRVWLTGEHQHDGLRVSGGAVLDRLMAL